MTSSLVSEPAFSCSDTEHRRSGERRAPADVDRGGSGNPRPRGNPPVVALKCHAKPVIVDPQIAVATAHDRLRHDLLHLLRHNSHVGLVTLVIGEAIETQ